MKDILLYLSLLLFVEGVAVAQMEVKQDVSKLTDVCYKWQTQVDPTTDRITIDQTVLDARTIQEGISCLLKMKGKKNKARFYGDTKSNYNKSARYKEPKNPATVEIAALYYISYLYYANWEHASSVALFDEATDKINSKEAVSKAYKSYEEWFQKVSKAGLEKAREQKLDPLTGSGVRWN